MDVLRSSALPSELPDQNIKNQGKPPQITKPTKKKSKFQDAEAQKQLQPKGVDQTDTLSCDSRAPNHRQEIGLADGRLLLAGEWWMVGVGGAGGNFNAFLSNAILFIASLG